jgi:hypothetical protein
MTQQPDWEVRWRQERAQREQQQHSEAMDGQAHSGRHGIVGLLLFGMFIASYRLRKNHRSSIQMSFCREHRSRPARRKSRSGTPSAHKSKVEPLRRSKRHAVSSAAHSFVYAGRFSSSQTIAQPLRVGGTVIVSGRSGTSSGSTFRRRSFSDADVWPNLSNSLISSTQPT